MDGFLNVSKLLEVKSHKQTDLKEVEEMLPMYKHQPSFHLVDILYIKKALSFLAFKLKHPKTNLPNCRKNGNWKGKVILKSGNY